jgi:hypothetical protein
MAVQQLSRHFDYFFSRINPSPTWVSRASSQYNVIKGVIEGAGGAAGHLSPTVFQQGSYGRDTAIYAINDIDLVALCELWYPPSSGGSAGQGWSRDEIFNAIAEPLNNDGRYSGKVRYGASSMCIKLDLGIKVEILPAVFRAGNSDVTSEPFYLYRPEKGQWEQGFAKKHQDLLTLKNKQTGGNFIPMVKVLKHFRSKFGSAAVSFHLECLLYRLPDGLYSGSPADYIASIVSHLANYTADAWYQTEVRTPCGDRDIFSSSEWEKANWLSFHRLLTQAKPWLEQAVTTTDRRVAIESWQHVLGDDYFPAYLS